MKYFSCASALMVILALGACASSDYLLTNYDGSEPAELMPTEGFLPVRELDAAGEMLDYVPRPNPYTDMRARLDKATVTTYIDARRAYHGHKFDFAEELLVKLVEEEPQLSGPWVMRGDIAMAEGDLAQAIEHYAEAIRINAVNFNAWLRLAKAQRLRGHFRHAQNTYAKALALWPDGPELHLNLGVLYDVYLNMPLTAQAHLEAYLLLNGDSNREALAWLEEIRARTGVAQTLKVIGPDGNVVNGSSQTAASATNDISSLAASANSKE